MVAGMGRLRLAAGLVALALLVPAATSSAATKADRSAAKRFANAAAEFGPAVRAQAPGVRILLAQARVECAGPLFRRAVAEGIPAQEIALVVNKGGVALKETVYESSIPALERFVARLDRIRTTDRVLVSGRAAWRRHLEMFRVYGALDVAVVDYCDRIAAWVDARGTQPWMPEVDFTAALREFQYGAGPREDRMEAAAERVRELGQTKLRANRFRFETTFAQQIAIEQAAIATYAYDPDKTR